MFLRTSLTRIDLYWPTKFCSLIQSLPKMSSCYVALCGYVSDCGCISDAWQSSVSIIADAEQSPHKRLVCSLLLASHNLAVWTYVGHETENSFSLICLKYFCNCSEDLFVRLIKQSTEKADNSQNWSLSSYQNVQNPGNSECMKYVQIYFKSADASLLLLWEVRGNI